MSFDLLPPDLLIEIFHQLPFKDRVRLAGVNRSFRDASEESIYKMKSLDVTDSLVAYSLTNQSLSSLLESSSSTLESIDASDQSCNKWLIRVISDFVYPKLERLELTVMDNALTKQLISQCRNLRSIVLHLNRVGFEWPENVVLEKLEKVELHSIDNYGGQTTASVSRTLRSFIGNVPNLKNLSIKGGPSPHFGVYVQEITQLLASTPYLEGLDLGVNRTTGWYADCNYIDMGLKFIATIPTWQLPKLTTLAIDFGFDYQFSSSALRNFSTSFPRIHLRELRLPVQISKAELIDVITNIPSLATVELGKISDALSTEEFIEFVTSTAAIFRRNLTIRFHKMIVSGGSSELRQMKTVFEEMKNNGGPIVQIEIHQLIQQISYKCMVR